MDALDGNTITTIIAILAALLVRHYFISRQIAAMEKRLMRDLSDLRREIRAIKIRPVKSVEANSRRIDETNAEIRILIKGALGVSSQSRERDLVSAE